MADRRIDQLTEAEDISDEDLFVIWKENISQTRSIAKGTMNLASKDYVDNLVASRMPDWSNAVNITYTQINQGYTFDDDGFFVLTGRGGTNAEAWVTINNVKVSFYSTYVQQIDAQIQTMVNRGDIVKSPHELRTNFTASFIPFKSMD